MPLNVFIPPESAIGAMALSPDGRSIAVLRLLGKVASPLVVYNLTTGSSHTWADPRCPGSGCFNDGLGGANTLSWTSDGRTLELVLSGLRLLNVSAPGHNALADARRIPLHGAPPTRPGQTRLDGHWLAAQITPDGRSIFIVSQYLTDHESLMRFSARTGALQSVVNAHPDGQLLWTSANGDTLILTGLRPGADAGIVSGGHFTPIPWSGTIQDAAW